MTAQTLVPTLLALFIWGCCLPAEAQEARQPPPALEAPASPKAPWRSIEPEGDPIITAETESEFSWVDVALWIPNRIMDFIDIFRFDIGIGPSRGGVVRLSEYAQAGYREMSPASVRIGNFGRRAPFMTEKSSEYGVGPGYHASTDRDVCPGEFGAGADLLIVGAYGGVCVDELADFVTGIFFIDLKKDDLRSR